MTTESRSRPKFQTTDLALAAFLIDEGFKKYELIRIEGGRSDGHLRGAWQFDPGNEQVDFDEAVTEFKDGEALVEPDAFLKIVTNIRRELFDFLGVK